MSPDISIHVKSAPEVSKQANAFYRLCGSSATVEKGDTIIFAVHNGEMIGIVRLCHEHGLDVLRTMRVRSDFQRQGVGLEMLQYFKEVVNSKGISKLFCLPYDHLESFYGSIGFKKIEFTAAPTHLQERLLRTQAERPSSKMIVMSI